MLFVLVTDMLCEIFTHAMQPKILVRVSIGEFGSKSNLHYADDLLILTTGGLEDLRIIKLMSYVFEGMSGMETNFVKTCMYSCTGDMLLSEEAAASLNFIVDLLLVTYLDIPISGRRPVGKTGRV